MRAAVLRGWTTLGPPITIVSGLMFYFGWARTTVQARYMGLDVSLFGFSTQDYVSQHQHPVRPAAGHGALASAGWPYIRRPPRLAQPAATARGWPAASLWGRAAVAAGALSPSTGTAGH